MAEEEEQHHNTQFDRDHPLPEDKKWQRYSNFRDAIDEAVEHVLSAGEDVDTGHWQGVKTEGKPDLITRELLDYGFSVSVGGRSCSLGSGEFGSHIDYDEILDALAREIQPNLPWADDHFEERVSRVPSNPGEQYMNWPWWRGQEELAKAHDSLEAGDDSMRGFKFTHTYQERFWPKRANHSIYPFPGGSEDRMGVRYVYGDLDDVVNLLLKEPYTRQATFPIFFPEDTGAVHGGRIPCTLHYHFLLRNDQLHMWYPIRSCDAVRHFRDDVYLACRLMLWVLEELQNRDQREPLGGWDHKQESDPPAGGWSIWDRVQPGTLHFTAYSFHIHKGDLHHVQNS